MKIKFVSLHPRFIGFNVLSVMVQAIINMSSLRMGFRPLSLHEIHIFIFGVGIWIYPGFLDVFSA